MELHVLEYMLREKVEGKPADRQDGAQRIAHSKRDDRNDSQQHNAQDAKAHATDKADPKAIEALCACETDCVAKLVLLSFQLRNE